MSVTERRGTWTWKALKLRDDDAAPSVRHDILIDQDRPRAMICRRDDNGRVSAAAMTMVDGEDASIELADPGVILTMRVIYKRVDLWIDCCSVAAGFRMFRLSCGPALKSKAGRTAACAAID